MTGGAVERGPVATGAGAAVSVGVALKPDGTVTGVAELCDVDGGAAA